MRKRRMPLEYVGKNIVGGFAQSAAAKNDDLMWLQKESSGYIRKMRCVGKFKTNKQTCVIQSHPKLAPTCFQSSTKVILPWPWSDPKVTLKWFRSDSKVTSKWVHSHPTRYAWIDFPPPVSQTQNRCLKNIECYSFLVEPAKMRIARTSLSQGKSCDVQGPCASQKHWIP